MLHLLHLLYTFEHMDVGVRRTVQTNPVIYARSLVRALAVSACVLSCTMGRGTFDCGAFFCCCIFCSLSH